MRDIIIPLGWDSNCISFESHHIESHSLFVKEEKGEEEERRRSIMSKTAQGRKFGII
jgi:hypothetical protein